jgi:hypothetical protein
MPFITGSAKLEERFGVRADGVVNGSRGERLLTKIVNPSIAVEAVLIRGGREEYNVYAHMAG